MVLKLAEKIALLIFFILLANPVFAESTANDSVKILAYIPGSNHVNTSVMLGGELSVQKNESAIALNYIDSRGFPNSTLVIITTPLNFSGSSQLVTLFRPTDNFEGRYTITSIGLMRRTAIVELWGWVGGDWRLNPTLRMNSSTIMVRGFGKNPDHLEPA